MVPITAFGCNNAIESVASLTNQLHALLKGNANPTTEEVEKAFARYQKEREGRALSCVSVTGDYCRRSCWSTWFGWFITYWLSPLLGDVFVVNAILSPWIKDSIKLDFVGEKHPLTGKVPWKYT